jgi:AraC family transcriptional regulator of adaptative response/methylated-DNA-[protein]-cysteine methyltransferase
MMTIDADTPTSDEMRYAIDHSSLGPILVARSNTGVSAVLFGDDRDALECDLRSRFPRAILIDDRATLATFVNRVLAFVEDPARGLNVPLDLRGSDFQRVVWAALREIPAGSTASYTDIAHRIGRPTAVRAVAHACAANPLAVVVPCHRVVRSDGGLSGYRWGVERKRTLLEREREVVA